jgi:hypothetical protein
MIACGPSKKIPDPTLIKWFIRQPGRAKSFKNVSLQKFASVQQL